MNKLKLTVALNYALLKDYKKSILFALGCAMIYGLCNGSLVVGLGFAGCMCATFCSYPFSVEERSGAMRLSGLLPVRRRDLVAGRYVFFILMGLVVCTVFLVAQLGLRILVPLRQPTDLPPVCAYLIGLLVFLSNISIQTPWFYKLGIMKSRVVMLLPWIIWFPIMFILLSAENLFNLQLGRLSPPALLLGLLVLVLGLVYVSFRASVRIYEAKEI